MNEKNLATKSIAVAAFLAARNNRLVQIERQGRDVSFQFAFTPELQGDLDDWQFGDATVNARTFTASRNHLLDLIHNDGGA